jgi:hypothetical protein
MLAFSGTALATNPTYDFNLENTGQSFNIDSGSTNKKSYANRGWTLYVDELSIESGSAGMCFVPFRRTSGSTYSKSGNVKWITRVRSTPGTYGTGEAVANAYYRIAARIDDDYDGPFSASGSWNSDT